MNHTSRRHAGSTLIMTLLSVVLIIALISVMVMQAASEARNTQNYTGQSVATNLARSGMVIARQFIHIEMKRDLEVKVRDNASAVDDPTGAAPYFADTYAEGSTNSNFTDLKRAMQTAADAHACSIQNPDNTASATLDVYIFFTDTACAGTTKSLSLASLPQIALPDGGYVTGAPGNVQQYNLPFVVLARANIGGIKETVVQNGEYRFRYGSGGWNYFAQFADDTGDTAFATTTPMDGPVHTNGYFRIVGRPYFGDFVTSSGCTSLSAGLCNAPSAPIVGRDGSVVNVRELTPSPNAPCVSGWCPQFTTGADFQLGTIPLPTTHVPIVTALASGSTPTTANVLPSGSLIYTGNLGLLELNGQQSDYQYIRTCPSADGSGNCARIRIRVSDRQIQQYGTTFFNVPIWRPSGTFNGVIYVAGNLESLRATNTAAAAVSKNMQLTVAAGGYIRVTSSLYTAAPACTTHIRSDDTTGVPTLANCGTFSELNANTTVLGLYSASSDGIFVGYTNGNAALKPSKSMVINAAIMTPNGSFTVDPDANTGQQIAVLGSIITKRYLATWPRPMPTSYVMSFDYDPRFGMGIGLVPPGFPRFSRLYLGGSVIFDPPRSLLETATGDLPPT
ncbi:DUF4900 domain-containing protein [Deinococcus soli (ex Cha et al. 2016)]|uniref:Tfp pilus assembly protein PilX n=2 Tax=Deinococcus soli (ex Cha et al. 2016) TaxID=1309411 RepID=A0AAE4BMH3_9DEIO|nr:DUF4900 domain-containing protein [Deinococcus soli (ex Cha et al. 2016)]MDR6218497.1 Tfp pilus assembly protein PilX [Deinococcus soli (ex Cha et al. 2016)]MDR6329237.1 Tfp pilus assembly protein PilX [Deinococcus soli (ex Cha et al. 2016)]MDR6751510.1 Tfp pilus assembly protein PilX [Deinococcus soli (ex Cha et al. 2016)]